MKAVIEFENVDVETGEVMRSQATALASMTEQGMKLTYVEDVSGDGHKTRCTMIFSNNQLRVTRSGAWVNASYEICNWLRFDSGDLADEAFPAYGRGYRL